MRVALARILLMRPDAMLLDEPSNHLDLESLIWLEAFLKDYDGALLMTSHDRAFMNRIIDKVVEIDGGQLITYSGDLDFYDQQRALSDSSARRGAVRAQCNLMLCSGKSSSSSGSRRAPRTPPRSRSRVKKLDEIERVERDAADRSSSSSRGPPRSGDPTT